MYYKSLIYKNDNVWGLKIFIVPANEDPECRLSEVFAAKIKQEKRLKLVVL